MFHFLVRRFRGILSCQLLGSHIVAQRSHPLYSVTRKCSTHSYLPYPGFAVSLSAFLSLFYVFTYFSHAIWHYSFIFLPKALCLCMALKKKPHPCSLFELVPLCCPADLRLMSSCNPPTSAFKVPGIIIGLCCHIWLVGCLCLLSTPLQSGSRQVLFKITSVTFQLRHRCLPALLWLFRYEDVLLFFYTLQALHFLKECSSFLRHQPYMHHGIPVQTVLLLFSNFLRHLPSHHACVRYRVWF